MIKKKFPLLLLFLLFAVVTACISDNEPDQGDFTIKTGERCPDFSVATSDGSTVTTSSLRGEKSLLVFFNTSCPDCQRELPQIQALYDEVREKKIPLRILCIARNENASSISSYWAKHSLSLLFSPQEDTKVFNLFADYGIPRLYLISEDLVIVDQWDENNAPSPEDILANI